jgi:hypothetical protein
MLTCLLEWPAKRDCHGVGGSFLWRGERERGGHVDGRPWQMGKEGSRPSFFYTVFSRALSGAIKGSK